MAVSALPKNKQKHCFRNTRGLKAVCFTHLCVADPQLKSLKYKYLRVQAPLSYPNN